MKTDELLAAAYAERHPEEAARVLEAIGPEASSLLMKELRAELAAGALARSTPAFVHSCLTRVDPARAAAIVAHLELDLAARLLRGFDETSRSEILGALPEKTRVALERLLRFPDGTVGSVMEPRVLALPADLSVEEAVGRLGREAHHLHSYVYVVDRDGKLAGVIAVRELMLAPPERPIASMMRSAAASLSSRSAIHEILVHPGWQDFHALPVVDRDGVLLGAVRYSTYRRLEREARAGGRARDLIFTGVALAELYWLVLARALTGVTPGSIPEPAESTGSALETGGAS